MAVMFMHNYIFKTDNLEEYTFPKTLFSLNIYQKLVNNI